MSNKANHNCKNKNKKQQQKQRHKDDNEQKSEITNSEQCAEMRIKASKNGKNS